MPAPCRAAPSRDRGQAADPPRPAHDPCRPRCGDDQRPCQPTHGIPRGLSVPQPAAYEQRQPLLREPIQDLKNLKNHPDFRDRFERFDHALDCSRRLIEWYNNHHRHMNPGLLTPAAVHPGAAVRILDQRRVVLKEAHALHPERFVRGIPKPSSPAAEVWINPTEDVVIPGEIQLPHDTHFVPQVFQSH